MGEPWMMFTKTQADELINNTTYEYTTVNGINCGKFINKIDSSKYIFLPAAGYWDVAYHDRAGLSGHYWSTLWYSSTNTWSLYFYYGDLNMTDARRRYGRSIRAIRLWKW